MTINFSRNNRINYKINTRKPSVKIRLFIFIHNSFWYFFRLNITMPNYNTQRNVFKLSATYNMLPIPRLSSYNPDFRHMGRIKSIHDITIGRGSRQHDR